MKVQWNSIYVFILFKTNCSTTNYEDINNCEPDPCIHGSCRDAVNSFTCACNPGYSGTKCAKGKTKFDSFLFKSNCHSANIKDVNECEPEPCEHGSCTDGVNSHTCECDPGYSGRNCNESTKKFHSSLFLVYNQLPQY